MSRNSLLGACEAQVDSWPLRRNTTQRGYLLTCSRTGAWRGSVWYGSVISLWVEFGGESALVVAVAGQRQRDHAQEHGQPERAAIFDKLIQRVDQEHP